jgi:ADP-ribose pyrophosphatase YjhB (NUDIX family)
MRCHCLSSTWTGAAAVCIQANNILMVLQGKPEEEKTWSVPSGGRNQDETYEECCRREMFEETGYEIIVKDKIMIKADIVHYFNVEIVGGEARLHDPDQLIYEIAWKTAEELETLNLSFEEDRDFLINLLRA